MDTVRRCLLSEQPADKVLVGELALRVSLREADQIRHLFLVQLLPERRHDVAEVGGAHVAQTVLDEDPEGLIQLVERIAVVLHLGQERHELGEVEHALSARDERLGGDEWQ